MTLKRTSPLTRAEVEYRVAELKYQLSCVEFATLGAGSTSYRRRVAGLKASIGVMERKLEEWCDVPT